MIVKDRMQHNRFKDASWYPKEDIHILIGGAGGIGSWVTLLLARAGFKPIVYDNDLLEEHNLSGQLYPKRSINLSKVSALQALVKDFSDDSILVMNEKIDEQTATNKYCIAAFDNMKARKDMYLSWLGKFGNDDEALFIDGRLTAEQMWIYCIKSGGCNTINQHEYFSNKLFLDSEIAEEPCTMKQTSHAAAMIASHIVGFFTNHIANIITKSEARSVPFEWEYFIPMDLLQVK